MKTRIVTLVSGSMQPAKVKHFVGLPPELTDGEDTRQEMASARILLIQAHPDGVFLYRFSNQGNCVGDTWHMSVEEAKRQAAFEYEGLIENWIDVPSEIEDKDVISHFLGKSN